MSRWSVTQPCFQRATIWDGDRIDPLSIVCNVDKSTSKVRDNFPEMFCHESYYQKSTGSPTQLADVEAYPSAPNYKQGEGSTPSAMEIKLILDSNISVDKVVQDLVGTAHDAVHRALCLRIRHKRFQNRHYRGCEAHIELG